MKFLDDLTTENPRTSMQTTRCPYARCEMVLAVAIPYIENEEYVKAEVVRTINRHLEQSHGWTLLQFQQGKLDQAKRDGVDEGYKLGVKQGRYLERRDWIEAMRGRHDD